MFIEVLLFLFLTSFLWYCQFVWNRKFLYREADKIPGPKGLPMIGHGAHFLNCDNEVILNYIVDVLTKYPKIAKVWFGPYLVIGIGQPKLIEALLNHHGSLKKNFIYDFFSLLWGSGLLTADVPTWKKHRKVILPTLNPKILIAFITIFNEHFRELEMRLDGLAGTGEEFDILPLLLQCNFELICDTLMNVKLSKGKVSPEFFEEIHHTFEQATSRVVKMWQFNDAIYQFTDAYKKTMKIKKKLLDLADSVIEENKEPKRSASGKQVFINALINSRQMSDQEIIDEVITFLLAGSDTTANTGSFLLLMLGMYPEIQEKVYEELIDVIGAESPVCASDLPHLKYTERVIKETMRFFPVGPIIARDIVQDVPLPNGVTLPKGSSVGVAIINVHKNPEYWPEPEKFDPDRFLPEEVAKRHPYAYLPFSSGLRPCPGNKYAMMSMKTMVSVLVRDFKFATPYQRIEDIKLKLNIMIESVDPRLITVTKRHANN